MRTLSDPMRRPFMTLTLRPEIRLLSLLSTVRPLLVLEGLKQTEMSTVCLITLGPLWTLNT